MKLEYLTYIEMCEAILRLTYYISENTEFADVPLKVKLGYMLDPILAIVEEDRWTGNNKNVLPEDDEGDNNEQSGSESEVDAAEEDSSPKLKENFAKEQIDEKQADE